MSQEQMFQQIDYHYPYTDGGVTRTGNQMTFAFPEAEYLYHYTDREGAMQILRSKYIKASTDTTRDAICGKGVYLTSLGPEFGRETISKNNYGDSRYINPRVEYFFKFKLKDLKAIENAIILDQREKCDGRDVYLFAMKNIKLDLVTCECGNTDDYKSSYTVEHGEIKNNVSSSGWCNIL